MTTFSCRVNGLIGGSFPWSTGFLATGALSEAAASTLFAAQVALLWNTATNGLQNFMNADITTTNTRTVTLDPATFKQTTGTTATVAIAGTDANASLPWDTAHVITLRSTLLRKSGHGRMYLPAFAEDQIVSHVLKAATTAKMKIVFDAFWSAIVGGGLQPVVMNRRVLNDGTAAFTQHNLVTYDISDKPAQQRRRVSKVVPTRLSGTI